MPSPLNWDELGYPGWPGQGKLSRIPPTLRVGCSEPGQLLPQDSSSHLCLSARPPPSVCRARQWHCTGRRCGGWCQAAGAPHYVTFDGLAFTFPGACEYLLVREAGGRFTISAQNLPCGASGLTCTKALTVQLQSTIVRMLRGGCGREGRTAAGGALAGIAFLHGAGGLGQGLGSPTAHHQYSGAGVSPLSLLG